MCLVLWSGCFHWEEYISYPLFPISFAFIFRCLVQGNSLMRLLCVGAFAVSGYSSTEGRTCKPFNPLLGETYEADYPDKGLRFFSEKACTN
jgi:hypothetical protein